MSRRVLPLFAVAWMACSAALAAPPEPIDVGSRLELFVDDYLVESMDGAELRLHHPVPAPQPESPLPPRFMMTVIKDGDLYRAWWRGSDPSYTGETFTGHPGETVLYAESDDGVEWRFPDFRAQGLHDVPGEVNRSTILTNRPPYLTNFIPFLDTRPGVSDGERYKTLAGYPGKGDKRELRGEELEGRGLFAFVSPDGIRWTRGDEVIPYQQGWRHAFDSPNVAFWSETEQQYVCYFRVWTPGERLRSIARTTSEDFVNWTEPVELDVNLEGEHLYSNNTTPYFRAPHIYLAFPTRFVPDRGDAPHYDPKDVNSTDIMFMTWRAGVAEQYDRTFTEAFMRPGRDPGAWGNRANFLAINVVPTAEDELSLYSRVTGRHTLRTDGFASAHVAGLEPGEVVTRPVLFEGEELVLNFATSAAGDVRVELQDASGEPLEGFALGDCRLLVGDQIARAVRWEGGRSLGELEGKPVRLRFVLRDADVYSWRFR